ncbi:Cytochrome P450 94A1 [Penicillium rolfsii]|nr:Cytochrome P450 94A1 [Penicillium rolfsii]
MEVLRKSSDFETPHELRRFFSLLVGNGLIALQGPSHRRFRRLQSRPFAAENVRQLYNTIWVQTDLLLQSWQQQIAEDTQSVDITFWIPRFTLSNIARLAVGHDLNDSTQPNIPLTVIERLLKPSLSNLITMFFNIFMPWLVQHLPWPTQTRMSSDVHSLRMYCYGLVRQSRSALPAAKEGPQQLLSTLLATPEVSDHEVADHLVTTLMAGSETVSSTIIHCCDLLCRNPDLQNRLRTEIRTHLPSPETQQISFEQFESLPLLHGVCEETMRLYPMIPSTLRVATRETTVQGEHIPKGTHVLLDFYALNRDKDIWGEDSDAFIPERWIDDAQRHRFFNSEGKSHFTFSAGDRHCIGREVARAELRCVMAGLIGRFSMELVHPEQEFHEAGAIGPRSTQPIYVRLRSIEGW